MSLLVAARIFVSEPISHGTIFHETVFSGFARGTFNRLAVFQILKCYVQLLSSTPLARLPNLVIIISIA
jgi:hypothetical protein